MALAEDRCLTCPHVRDRAATRRAWRALLDGEWRLVEVFERSGRRFMVATRAPAHAPRAPLLDARERVALSMRARGHRVKVIAYELGVSQASVSRAITSAMKKLGLRGLADVLRFGGEHHAERSDRP